MVALQPQYLEVSDVARVLGITPARVRDLADEGRLPIAAMTIRGSRLFAADAIETLHRERAAQAAERRAR